MKTISNEKRKTIIIDKLKQDQEFIVKNNEEKTFVIFLIDGKDQVGDVNIKITGSNAHVQIYGCILGYGIQKIHINSLQDHEGPASISNLLIKSVLFGKAQLYYEGLITIAPGAAKSNAYQKNQNLLMSDGAWADSRPYLEIKAHDVRCTHGATIGKINQDQLYYLHTRGLSDKSATQLIVGGYFQDVLDRISDTRVRNDLEKQISMKIKTLL